MTSPSSQRPSASGRSTRPPRFASHEAAAGVIGALQRLAKVVQIHALDNDAVRKAAESACSAVRELTDLLARDATVTFVHDMVFSNGELLRADRNEYAAAAELAGLLGHSGVNEIVLSSEVTEEQLLELAALLVAASREADHGRPPAAERIANVELRKVDSPLGLMQMAEDADPLDRALAVYATALAVMRAYFDAVRAGVTAIPPRVKRVSQRLVMIWESDERAAHALLSLATSHRDAAGFAVHTALLSIAVARQAIRDPVVLGRIALSALLCDAGRVRASLAVDRGTASHDRLRGLPAVASTLCLVAGDRTEATMARAVTVYEVNALEGADFGEPLYGRDGAPLVTARLIRTVRAFLDAMAPADAGAALSPAHALGRVAALPDADPVLLRLMVSALGLLPAGTVVELATGEWAVVVGTSPSGAAPHRPRIRLVTDSRGCCLERPRDVDLADHALEDLSISRVIPPEVARFNTTNALSGLD